MLTDIQKKAVRTYIQQISASADKMAQIGAMADADVIAMLQEYIPGRVALLDLQQSDAQGILNRETATLQSIDVERTLWKEATS